MRVFRGPWEGEIPQATRWRHGFALRLEPTPNPTLEAERVRRILSWAPRRFLDAGWTQSPEMLVYGDPRAIRELPTGLADVAVIPAADDLREDRNLARTVAIHSEEPRESPPAWAGLPVLMGPRLFYRCGWIEDTRTRPR